MTTKVIDFRLRPPVKGFFDLVMYAKAERRDGITRQHGMEPAASAQAKSMEMLLAEMDDAGVTCGVVMGRYWGFTAPSTTMSATSSRLGPESSSAWAR